MKSRKKVKKNSKRRVKHLPNNNLLERRMKKVIKERNKLNMFRKRQNKRKNLNQRREMKKQPESKQKKIKNKNNKRNYIIMK